VSTLHEVRKHLDAQARAHHQAHEEALRKAAIARAEADAHQDPNVPQVGLQGGDEGFWEVGAE
jgi:hypothetical protein